MKFIAGFLIGWWMGAWKPHIHIFYLWLLFLVWIIARQPK